MMGLRHLDAFVGLLNAGLAHDLHLRAACQAAGK
jgi:hypothetical protein